MRHKPSEYIDDATLKKMGKCITWNHHQLKNKQQQNKVWVNNVHMLWDIPYCRIFWLHWNVNVVLIKFSSLVASQIFKMTTFCIGSDKKIHQNITIFLFQFFYFSCVPLTCISKVDWPLYEWCQVITVSVPQGVLLRWRLPPMDFIFQRKMDQSWNEYHFHIHVIL